MNDNTSQAPQSTKENELPAPVSPFFAGEPPNAMKRDEYTSLEATTLPQEDSMRDDPYKS